MYQELNRTLANPFYSARVQPPTVTMVKLPVIPRNNSPVPHLTSLYHNAIAGNYGDRSYPGNCGGNLIKDLLSFYRPVSVFDPMTGSGTCRDVCEELDIPCKSTDLRQGFDATDAVLYQGLGLFDFIWAHPPYWRQKIYSDSPNDLSQCKSLACFSAKYRSFIGNCVDVLAPGGKLAILMGDYHDREVGFVPLTFYTKQIAFECGLQQACTDIVRFSHGATSSRKIYRSSLIPALHDMCMVFTKTPTRTPREWRAPQKLFQML